MDTKVLRFIRRQDGGIIHGENPSMPVHKRVMWSMVVEIQPPGVIFKNSFIFYRVFCYSSLVVKLLELGDFPPLSIIVQFIKHPVVNK